MSRYSKNKEVYTLLFLHSLIFSTKIDLKPILKTKLIFENQLRDHSGSVLVFFQYIEQVV